ncbi:hypothetical protein [Antrihabitans cavernicola]|uniref:Uncharacterized protein n=1 Tax=Antrihabitans cavernicola TaxID=2495913 RepID=A0A5A7S4V9_9NOCA|nr:hypothetical protein [Spelaeibacter cavernicola]KAA0016502.1 hypothetical protein FOY51_26185 [Spelaeibacter cavernicola]
MSTDDSSGNIANGGEPACSPDQDGTPVRRWTRDEQDAAVPIPLPTTEPDVSGEVRDNRHERNRNGQSESAGRPESGDAT